MPDHRVEGVGRAIDDQPRHTGDRSGEQRSDHRVGRVLGHRLDDGAGDLARVERVGVTADEVGQPATGGVNESASAASSVPAVMRPRCDDHNPYRLTTGGESTQTSAPTERAAYLTRAADALDAVQALPVQNDGFTRG